MEIKSDLTLHVQHVQNKIMQNPSFSNHLIYTTLLFLLLFLSNFSFAEMSKISFTATSENVNESLEMASKTVANTYDRQSFSARYDVSGINRVLDLGVGTNYTRTDYSKFFVRNATTTIVPLTTDTTPVNEYSIDASMLYLYGSWGYILSTSQPVDKKFFKQSSYQVGVTRSYFRKSTIFNLIYQQSDLTRPITYYRDPETFVIKSQATKIKTNSVLFDWEQILTEKIKTKNGLSYTDETDERPSNYSAFTKWAFTLTPRVFYKVNYKYTKELTSVKLKNDRGYFTNHLFNNEVSWEFIYDWILSVSYSLAREDEYDSRTLARRRTGVDQYGLSLDYSFSKALVSLSVGHMESNTDIKSTQITLGFTWSF